MLAVFLLITAVSRVIQFTKVTTGVGANRALWVRFVHSAGKTLQTGYAEWAFLATRRPRSRVPEAVIRPQRRLRAVSRRYSHSMTVCEAPMSNRRATSARSWSKAATRWGWAAIPR